MTVFIICIVGWCAFVALVLLFFRGVKIVNQRWDRRKTEALPEEPAETTMLRG